MSALSNNADYADAIDVEPVGAEFSDEALDVLAALLIDYAGDEA